MNLDVLIRLVQECQQMLWLVNNIFPPLGCLLWSKIVQFHFTCLGTEKNVQNWQFLYVLSPNHKSSHSYRLEFSWKIHFNCHSFRTCWKQCHHFEITIKLFTIVQDADLVNPTLLIYACAAFWEMFKIHDVLTYFYWSMKKRLFF